jgi:hypothetical protein
MNAAGRELRLRRDGKVKQEAKGKSTRPFGVTSDKYLKAFASLPDPSEQKAKAKQELQLRKNNATNGTKPTRAFGQATDATIRFFATANLNEIETRNLRDIDG